MEPQAFSEQRLLSSTIREAMRKFRNIKTLCNFEPRVARDEIQLASLQYDRKVTGFHHPSSVPCAALLSERKRVVGRVRLPGAPVLVHHLPAHPGHRREAVPPSGLDAQALCCLSVNHGLGIEVQNDMPRLQGLCPDDHLLGALVEDDELIAEPRLAVIETKVQGDPVQGLYELARTSGFEDPVLGVRQEVQRCNSLSDIPADDRIVRPQVE